MVRVDEVMKALPEIEEVHDPELRRKTAEIWAEAWEMSRWSGIEDAIMYPGMDVLLLSHLRSVLKSVMAAAEAVCEYHGIHLDHDVLLCGILLHDVGKLVEYQPDEKALGGSSHSSEGKLVPHAVLGGCLAFKAGMPLNIVHMISAHSVEGDHLERSPECSLMHRVDFGDWDTLVAVRRG